MMSRFVIETHQLGRDFRHTTAVNKVQLQVESGVIAGIIGPNGAGKTTLLHLVAGLLEPTRGRCSVLGHPARRLPGALASQIICVGDRNEPPGWYSIGELMLLQNDASDRFDMLFARQLLAEREFSETSRWSALSKGHRRWVLATLAIAARPQVLLMDEPADGLDPHARRSLYNHLRDFVNDYNSTVLVCLTFWAIFNESSTT
jgi:ABC-2 type transport system ATP-binding protein